MKCKLYSVVQKKKNNKLPIINCIVIGFSEYFQNHILHIMVFKMNRIFRKFKHMYICNVDAKMSFCGGLIENNFNKYFLKFPTIFCRTTSKKQ